jgi:hypothetical protein
MSRAEDLANKYCEGSSFEDACMEKPAYIAGYHQATEEIYEWLSENFFNYFEARMSMFDMCLEDLKQAIIDE